jgi:hypothetical protein
MKNSFLAVIVGALVAGCGGADTSQSLAMSERSKEMAVGMTTCDTGDDDAEGLRRAHTTYSGNLFVPAGATCRLYWSEVKGNTIVNGNLVTIGSTFRNVIVDGGSLTVLNWGCTFHGNVSIKNSAGRDGGGFNGFWSNQGDAGSTVEGNLIYENDTAQLYTEGNLTVLKNFNFSGSRCPAPSVNVVGQSNVSGC